MAKISNTKQLILNYLAKNPQTSVVKLVDYFLISKQAMQKHLKQLIEINKIKKTGLPPKVYYSVLLETTPENEIENEQTDLNISEILKNFVIITADGQKLSGQNAMDNWCKSRGLDSQKYSITYVEVCKKYTKYYGQNCLIDATSKIKNTFKSLCAVDSCFYGSFSSIEIFGRTGIYSQMLYAKQSANRKNMVELFPQVAIEISKLIKEKKIKAVGFVQPTVPRKFQLINELEKYLNLSLPIVKITKIKNQYIVPQKTLSKPEERKINAEETFVVESVPNVNSILLIDDFVGSGSSFNAIASKIKSKPELKANVEITCYAISGTPNGIINSETNKFEVVNEA